MKKQSILLLMTPLLLLLSCAKPTTESETKKWTSAQKTLQVLTTKYPKFEAALQVVKQESAVQWEAALNVTEEEQQIIAMQTANTAAYPEFVRQLDRVEDKIESLKSLCTRSTRGAVDRIDNESLRIARNNAQRTLSSVEYLLNNNVVRSPVEATVVTNEATKKIKNASNNVSKVLKRIANKARAKKQQEKAAKDKKETTTKTSKAVKCSYCSVKNSSTASTCKGCGAPVQ